MQTLKLFDSLGLSPDNRESIALGDAEPPTKGRKNDMMPKTINGLNALTLLSGLQKCIRRGLEEDAMLIACEILHTSKAYHTMVTNRLEIIAHEDIDTLSQPWIVPYVRAAAEQSRAWYDQKKFGKCRMPVGNIIRLLCRANKSREGDHFQAAFGLANLLEGRTPEIQDWMLDHHTTEGKRRGRGVEFFRTESVKLVPDPGPDPYQDEAYRLLDMKVKMGK